MFVSVQALDALCEFSWGDSSELSIRQCIIEFILCSVHRIRSKSLHDGTFVQFGIFTGFCQPGFQSVQCRIVRFDIQDKIFIKLYSLCKIFLQPFDGNCGVFFSGRNSKAGSNFVECLGDIFRRFTVSSEKLYILCGYREFHIIQAADFVTVPETEQIIVFIRNIENFCFSEISSLDVLVIIQENRLRRHAGHLFNHFHEGRLLVRIGFYGSDGRFFNFHKIFSFSFSLEDCNIIITKIFIGKRYDICFFNFGQIIDIRYLRFPVEIGSKGIHQQSGPSAVCLGILDNAFLGIVDDGRNKVVIKVSFFKIFNFVQDKGFHLFQCLSGSGSGIQIKNSVVYERIGKGTCSQQFLFFNEIQVEKPCFSVGKDRSYKISQQNIFILVSWQSVPYCEAFRIGAYNFFNDRFCNALFRFEGIFRHRFVFHVRKKFVNLCNGLVRIKIS